MGALAALRLLPGRRTAEVETVGEPTSCSVELSLAGA